MDPESVNAMVEALKHDNQAVSEPQCLFNIFTMRYVNHRHQAFLHKVLRGIISLTLLVWYYPSGSLLF